MIFTPIFFAYIGISADFSSFTPAGLVFALCFVVAGIVGKIVGCGTSAKLFGYDKRESVAIGCGMIARGEVALAVYASGSGLIWKNAEGVVLGIDPLVATICLIIISSILCPVLLKLAFKDHDHIDGDKGVKVPETSISAQAIENLTADGGNGKAASVACDSDCVAEEMKTA